MKKIIAFVLLGCALLASAAPVYAGPDCSSCIVACNTGDC
jgi:hypothetical protein